MDRYGYRMRAYLLHLKGLAQDLGQGLLKGRVRLAPAMARPLVHGLSLPTAPPPRDGASMLIMRGNYLDDIMAGLKRCLLSITCRSHARCLLHGLSIACINVAERHVTVFPFYGEISLLVVRACER